MTILSFIDTLKLATGLAPVVVFLLVLVAVFRRRQLARLDIAASTLLGAIAALVSLAINTVFIRSFDVSAETMARYGVPVIEELVKCGIVLALVTTGKRRRLWDAVVIGFGVGCGFAVIENAFYAHQLAQRAWDIWLFRGFSSAVLHGGIAALFGIVTWAFLSRGFGWARAAYPGLLSAMSVHAFYNNFVVSPTAFTVALYVFLPLVLVLVFRKASHDAKQGAKGRRPSADKDDSC